MHLNFCIHFQKRNKKIKIKPPLNPNLFGRHDTYDCYKTFDARASYCWGNRLNFIDPLTLSLSVSIVFTSHEAMQQYRYGYGLEEFGLIYSERIDSYLVDNQLIKVPIFPMHMLTFLSVDEILLQRYKNWSTFGLVVPFGFMAY